MGLVIIMLLVISNIVKKIVFNSKFFDFHFQKAKISIFSYLLSVLITCLNDFEPALMYKRFQYWRIYLSLVDDIAKGGINDYLNLFDEVFWDLVFSVRHLHMSPYPIELFFSDRHMFMGFRHGSAFVVVGAAEHHAEKVRNQIM